MRVLTRSLIIAARLRHDTRPNVVIVAKAGYDCRLIARDHLWRISKVVFSPPFLQRPEIARQYDVPLLGSCSCLFRSVPS